MSVSDKNKCNFYNVGYCRNIVKGCEFLHPKESCSRIDCNYKSCPKRHQRNCKYFELKNQCKHGSECEFKHVKKQINVEKTDKANDLQSKLEESEKIVGELRESLAKLKHEKAMDEKNAVKRENKLKEANKESIDREKNLKIAVSKLREEVNKLNKDNKEKELKIDYIKQDMKNVENQKNQCRDCGEDFDKFSDLKEHLVENHNPLVARLKRIAQTFDIEKKKHKLFCEISSSCKHSGNCYQDCVYTVKNFVESDSDDNEEEEETADQVPEEITISLEKKCKECDFKAKNEAGLKIHSKNKHKYQCKKCEYKTTTVPLLKQHLDYIHI